MYSTPAHSNSATHATPLPASSVDQMFEERDKNRDTLAGAPSRVGESRDGESRAEKFYSALPPRLDLSLKKG
jgi:hypothetical protein